MPPGLSYHASTATKPQALKDARIRLTVLLSPSISRSAAVPAFTNHRLRMPLFSKVGEEAGVPSLG